MRALSGIAPRRWKEDGEVCHDVFAGPRSVPRRFKLLAHLPAPGMGMPNPPRQVMLSARHGPHPKWSPYEPAVQLARQPCIPRQGMLPPFCPALRGVLYPPILQDGEM